MQFGRKSFISKASVQDVLDSLIYTTQEPNISSLKHLFIVQKVTLNPKTPASDLKELYVIQSIITDVIVSQLSQIRLRFQLQTNLNESYANSQQSLIRDTQTESNDLLSWSLLYYLYVQVDLGFTIESISNLIGVTSRTTRRYRNYGIDLLTYALWQLENVQRELYHQESIYSQLKPITEPFIGRDESVGQVVDIVNNGGKLVHIYGEQGIGKTAFVKHCVLRLVETNIIDDVIWIKKAEDIDNVWSILQNHYLNGENDNSPEFVLALFNCIIVIDDVDLLFTFGNFLELLHNLRPATVFLISQKYYNIASTIHQIMLPPLDKNQTLEILHVDDRIPSEIQYYIAESTEGNPSQVLEMAKHFIHKDNLKSDVDRLRALQPHHRILLMLIPFGEGMLLSDFTTLCQMLKITESIRSLIFDYGILTERDEHVYCHIQPKYFAEFTHDISEKTMYFMPRLDELIEYIPIIEHFVTEYRIAIPQEILIMILKLYWKDGLMYGQQPTWYSLMVSLRSKEDSLWFQLALGVVYKQMNDLALALPIILKTIEDAGMIGDFQIQAEATLQLIKIYRLNGNYKSAMHYLNITDSVLEQYLAIDQQPSLMLEKAQLALDNNEINYALSLISPLNSYEALAIHAECAFRLNQLNKCLELCDNILSNFELPDVMKGTIHNLMGLCHQRSQVERAAEHYSLAIEYFRKGFNLRNLSRAQINLATLFIYMEELDEARSLLSLAEEVCVKINDVIGLKTISKNKNHIDRLIISQYM